jgi:hypothetical protein
VTKQNKDLDLDSAFDAIEENKELRSTLQRTQRALAKASSKRAEIEDAVLTACRDAYLAIGKPTPIKAPAKDKRKGGEEVALWHVTDLQTGKKTASYDMATMHRRIREFAEKAVKITEIMRAEHPVRSCTILFGGDMVENTTTFPGQVWEVEATTFVQCIEVANAMEALVRHALENYERVDVIAEPGNHGRIGKPSDGVPKGDNWDRIAYQIVAERFAGEKRLTWKSEDHWHQRFEIGNYKGVLVHGDEFKGFGGQTPLFGIIRKVNAWKSGVIPYFDSCYVGHFHNHNEISLAAGGSIYMTGSTESDNEFAREFVAASAVPSQRLHFVDPKRGRVTAIYKIELT